MLIFRIKVNLTQKNSTFAASSYKSMYQTAKKLSTCITLILGLLLFGIVPNTTEMENLYSTEREIEEVEREEESDKLDVAQHKFGHIASKGKNIAFFDAHSPAQNSMSAAQVGAFDIFFAPIFPQIVSIVTPFAPLMTSISPRYLLFHRLIFYC
ncbi:MAG: hypothetical protein ACKVTZ_18440 [Bacteroidia bacterium]